MNDITVITIDKKDRSEEYVIISHGNEEYTSILKSIYDEQQLKKKK